MSDTSSRTYTHCCGVNSCAIDEYALVCKPHEDALKGPALRSAVRKLDANLPVYLMKTEERQRDDSLAVEKLAATLSTAFGILATVLAAVGVHGVMAFRVVSAYKRKVKGEKVVRRPRTFAKKPKRKFY